MHTSRTARALLACAMLTGGVATAEETAGRTTRVLILTQFDPGLPAAIDFAAGVRSQLDPIVGYHVYADYLGAIPARLANDAREWLRTKHAAAPPDVVVAAGQEALAFLADPEKNPWPGVPVVFGMLYTRLAPAIPPGFTGVKQDLANRETIDLALRLLPATRHAVLVGGTSPLDRALADMLRADVGTFGGRLDVIDLVGLTTPQLEERLRALPRDCIVLVVSYLKDGAGQYWSGQQYAPRLSAAARAPLFSPQGVIVGYGSVGGVVFDYAENGRRVGRIVERIVGGAAAGSIPPEVATGRAVLDGRQLARWHVPTSRVPEGVEVKFVEPTLWARYRWLFIAGIVGLTLQAMLIVGLLFERRRRCEAEARSREDLAVVAHLNRVGAIGELAGAFAHELNSPLGAVVNNAQAARRFILAGPEHSGEVAACLDDIVSDARRAGEVVRRIRTHLRREDVDPVPLDVSAVIRDAVHLVSADARDRGVALSVEIAPGLPPLLGDDVQLVQVILNLVVNAFDAVAQVPPDRRRVSVEAAAVRDGVEIRVIDSGPGIPPEQLDRVFEPFFTTKRVGLGMGLAISRSIVEAHGGTIRAARAPGAGTAFLILLPTAARAAPAVEAMA